MAKNSLNWAHALIRDWFIKQFGSATEPQIQGWPAILAGKTTLISAPTGSGKTLAAFLTCIDHLVRKAVNNQLQDHVEVIYVSPLKALGNDIHKNLLKPLTEITTLAKTRQLHLADIRVAVRTGDTPTRDRQLMLKKPPHILITTPESLYLLLTAEKSRQLLTQVKTVIVDEIHAMVNDKRGTHLSLSLERLEALTQKSPNRIGLSATQKPIEVVAQFLMGNRRKKTSIINIGHTRHIDLGIEVPSSELGAVASNEMWEEIYDKIAALTKEHRSILIFVNTRRLAERVAHHLAERLGEEYVAAHHGSLARKLRLQAEIRLKNGELKILVATASLELGIDIGSIDLVCQIGSPHAIAVGLQRIGRAGHWRGAISKGRFFPTSRDDLFECAALIYAIAQGDLDQLLIPEEPLDILAQQIIATCATGDWQEEKLFALVKKAYPYRHLTRETFNRVLEMLAEGISGARTRYHAYLFRDQINGMVKARRGARLTAITNGGAIPETGLFSVIAEPQNIMVGTLDEDFAVESNRGDVILLGNTSWMIKKIENVKGRVIVEDAHGAPPSVPFWRGEAPARTDELSKWISILRETLGEFLFSSHDVNIHLKKQKTSQWLQKNCKLEQFAAKQIIEYLCQGYEVLGALPTQKMIIAERFFDESGGMQLIIHAPFGSRINKAWGLALRKRFCRSFNFELQAAATEDGINISLTQQHSFPLADVFQFLHPNSIQAVLTQAVLQSPLFTTRWRWDATRALALLRFRGGKKVPPNIQRMFADDLLAAVFPDAAACQDNTAGKDLVLPDHPLINETMKDILHEALDLPGLMSLLTAIHDGKMTCLAVDTPIPSVFSHEILNANPYAFLDDVPLEERRARAVAMRQVLPTTLSKTIGQLDVLAIQEVQWQAWPDIRNTDELHDFLQTVIVFPRDMHLPGDRQPTSDWHTYFVELVNQQRAVEVSVQQKKFWVAVEKYQHFILLYPHATPKKINKMVPTSLPNHSEVFVQLLSGWINYLGPTNARELNQQLQLPLLEIEQSFIQLETRGMVLRGFFTNADITEWCERRLLARIHRLTIDKLRKAIQPVSREDFAQWLSIWQHVAPGTQLHGEQGLLTIIEQLQGLEMPAKLWEKEIFAKRIYLYQGSLLDRLCLSGIVGWGRLSAIRTSLTKPAKRIRPTSLAPITFFLRENTQWISSHPSPLNNPSIVISATARKIYDFLQQRGASFFFEIENSVKCVKFEIENALWELVAAGLITADSFDNLRALIDPRRRQDRRKRKLQARFSSGRWSVLRNDNQIEHTTQLETLCWLLLKRYGVVCRDLLTKEKNILPWRDLLPVLRRLEDQGEIRGGRFISGLIGEQFALPLAVESLRSLKQSRISEKNSA